MSTQKHTDGPWHITKENTAQHFFTFIKVRDAHDGVIAGMHVNDEANARLIAAAPDLLAALKKVLTMTEGVAPLGSFGEQARAAIAKAEGVK
jgi:hypothetical protein